jgi:hypothetical protein
MSKQMTETEFEELQLKRQQQELEFIRSHYPEECGKICGFCKKKFDGWGNNPAPLKINKVCNDCNYIIISVRGGNFGGWRNIKKIQKMIEKQQK